MKHARIVILALIAVSALGGITASSSLAAAGPCVQVDEPGQGDWAVPTCFGTKSAGNYIRVIKFWREVPGGQWCAETEQENHGNRATNTCEGGAVAGDFILVKRAPPNWHVNGTKLSQGSKGITLQNKGTLSLKGTLSGLSVTISCGTSVGEGTIDGQGEKLQGQGKGVVKYTSCETKVGEAGGKCTKPTAITTNQLKSHLANAAFQGKEQIVELFEPGSPQTTNFVTIPLGECKETILNGINAPVKGSVAGVIEPQEEESQEGSLFFPTEPIKVVKHEGQELTSVGLTLNGTASTFTGWYSSKLQTGLKFGVFEN